MILTEMKLGFTLFGGVDPDADADADSGMMPFASEIDAFSKEGTLLIQQPMIVMNDNVFV